VIRRLLTKGRLLWRDSNTIGVLVRGATASFLLSTFGYALGFGLQILIAQLLGEVEYGIYSFTMAWLGIGLIIGKSGFDLAFIRFLPGYRVTCKWSYFHGLLRFGRWFPAIWGVAMASVGSLILEMMSFTPYRRPLLVALWLVPLAVFSELTAMVLRALRYVVLSLISDTILRPVLTALLLLAYVGFKADTATGLVAMYCYVVATAFACCIANFWLERHLPKEGRAVPPMYLLRNWLLTSLPLMFAAGFQALLYALDTLMLGMIVDTTTSGLYSAASKVALLVLFSMNAAQVIAGSLLSESWLQGRRDEVQRIVHMTINISLLFAVPAVVVLIVGGRMIMSIFGSEFAVAADSLRILAAVQLFNVATGPVGLVLSMSGHQNRLVAYLAMALILNFLLNLVWIPAYGQIGAACSTAIAHILWNILGVVFIWKNLRINCTPLRLQWFGVREVI